MFIFRILFLSKEVPNFIACRIQNKLNIGMRFEINMGKKEENEKTLKEKKEWLIQYFKKK